MKHGVDVSSFQPKVNWSKLRADGFEFASVRCCEGLELDSMHATHIANARSEGFKVGSYQIGHPSQDVTKLAEFFLKHAVIETGQIKPVPDMETLSNNHVPDNAGPWCDQWCEIVKEQSGANSMPYASSSYWLAMCAQRPALGGPFGWDWWCAAYKSGVGVCNLNDLQHPPTISGKPFVAWQWCGNIVIPGQVGIFDRDIVLAESLDAILL